MVYLRGRLDLEGGAVLATALDAMMRPPGPDDVRTAGQRRADAAVELCRQALARGEVPTVGGIRPQVGVLITPSMLLAATSTSGADNRPGQAADATTDAPTSRDPSQAPEDEASRRRAGPAHPEDPLARLGVPPLPELPWAHWVGEVPPELAQRIACDAEVWRAILDPAT